MRSDVDYRKGCIEQMSQCDMYSIHLYLLVIGVDDSAAATNSLTSGIRLLLGVLERSNPFRNFLGGIACELLKGTMRKSI